MKALQKTKAGFGLELRDIDPPGPPGSTDVLIEVEATGVCGSDVHIYEWTGGYEHVEPAMPVTLGHEFAGRITEVGSGVTDLTPGMEVAVRPSVFCGVCEACREQRHDLCAQRTSIGILRNGAFAPWVVVPATNCERLPDGVDTQLAALTEPMTIGARAVEVSEVQAGDRILVMGPGPIGHFIAVMAREAGARDIVVVGKDDADRLASMRTIGFEQTIDLADGDLESQAKRYLGTDQFDIVFEATGVPVALQQGLDVLRRGGVMVTCAIHAVPAAFDVTRFVRAQQQLRGSAVASEATWETVLGVLAKSGDQLRNIITHRLPLERALEGFELARQKAASKVVILPNA
jgi:2-desacetyl-2-hydroxyethyl bacteriochlorophyllide A dehydrogenase